MEKYFEKGQEIIMMLINNGYEAYFIGKCVRDTILQNELTSMEITTNAMPANVVDIFDFTKTVKYEDGVYVLYLGYEFFISTFRLDVEYSDDRTPVKIHYSKNLLDELAQRDYTINALTMSHNSKITDAYDGFRHLKKKQIRMIGKPKVRISENPITILVAASLISELGFKVERKSTKAIKKKRKTLINCSPRIIYNELNNIIEGNYSKRALTYIYENKIYDGLPDFKKGIIKLAKTNFKVDSMDQFVACCALANPEFSEVYFDFLDNKERTLDLLEIAYLNPKAKYSNFDLFKYGLDTVLEANMINYKVGRGPKRQRKIKKQYDKLIIKDISELAFSKEEIIELAALKPVDVVINLIDDVVYKILEKELLNDHNIIRIYCLNYLQILPNELYDNKKEEEYVEDNVFGNIAMDEEVFIDEVNVAEEDKRDYELSEPILDHVFDVSTESELEENLFEQGKVVKDFTEMKINQLEQRLREQERLLEEKDARLYELEKRSLQDKLNNDIDKIVQRNLDNLKDLNYINASYNEKILLGKELEKVYKDFLSSIDSKYRQIFSEDDMNEKNK